MTEKNMYVVVVEKSMVEEGNVLDVVKTIYKLTELKAFKQLAISFHGYDDTSTEVWEIPEIRQWCHKLVNKVPYLFYYLEQDVYQTQQIIMSCLNDYESWFEGEKKSPEEYAAEGKSYEELPRHMMKIHVHRKSMHEMYKEIRKHAKEIKQPQNAINLISEMSQRYGVSAD